MSQSLHHQLSLYLRSLSEKKLTLGFDGFCDTIVRVIRSREQDGVRYFESSEELGIYIQEKGKMNFGLELEEQTVKLGGNMPIMANALGNLGAYPSCLGAMGYPDLHPVFKNLASHSTLYSFANPGLSTALEFQGTKMLIATMDSMNHADWEMVKHSIGIDQLRALFTSCDLVAILNWSELRHATDIWKGLLKEVVAPTSPENKTIGFFDLADFSSRREDEAREALHLLSAFSEKWHVVLSLNHNETELACRALQIPKGTLGQMGTALFEQLHIQTLLIHYAKESLGWTQDGMVQQKSIAIQQPILSTGAGDNFNAGFCAGLLMDLDLLQAMQLAHLTASFYMTRGKSPSPNELTAWCLEQEHLL